MDEYALAWLGHTVDVVPLQNATEQEQSRVVALGLRDWQQMQNPKDHATNKRVNHTRVPNISPLEVLYCLSFGVQNFSRQR